MDMPLSSAWQVMHPPLQHHAQGWLAVGDGHEIYWEACGHPLAPPALVLHGGPGAGCSADDRRWFDPQRWRIVLVDQRGAGRSRPAGALAGNDTAHLVADIEALRRHLGIARWLLFGGSWGATLALAYAQQHADRVLGLVLRGVFTATADERDWLYTAQGAARQRPSAWQRLCRAAGHADGPLLDAAAAGLHGADPARAMSLAHAWLAWEQALMDPADGGAPPPRLPPDAQALAMARIGVHFARHAFFLQEGQLLASAGRLRGVAGVIVQGEHDLVTPMAAALALQRAWPAAQLRRVPAAGHASSDPAIARALIEATGFFSGLAAALTTAGDPR